MVVSNIVLKLATRCNIACRYCYWFRDPYVYDLPKRLTESAENVLIDRLAEHIQNHQLSKFSISFHGGEPLLFGKRRFADLCKKLVRLAQNTQCKLPLNLVTNGMLIDQEWVALFKKYDVSINLSIDGEPASHDESRIDFQGKGTYQRVEDKLRLLQNQGVNPPVLMVVNPSKSPKSTVTHLVDKLGVTYFNALIPDVTHDDKVEPISEYFCELFDLWFDTYVHQGVEIPIIEAIVKVILGGKVATDMIGLNKKTIVTVLTDGSIQASDEINSTRGESGERFSLIDHPLQAVTGDSLWQEIYHYSENLHTKCQSCEFKQSCGGSTIVSRWSKANRFNNPSVYCQDMQTILTHAKKRLTLYSPQVARHINASESTKKAAFCDHS